MGTSDMIEVEKLTDKDIGRRVIYERGTPRETRGIIKSWVVPLTRGNLPAVIVTYESNGHEQTIRTNARDLEFEDAKPVDANDLSGDAAHDWVALHFAETGSVPDAREGWLEAARRHEAIMAELKANPWQLFSDQDLAFLRVQFRETLAEWVRNRAKVELERRKGK